MRRLAPESDAARPRRAICRSCAYRLSVSNGFWLLVSVVYLQQVRGFGPDEVGLVTAGFSVANVVAEIPTGSVGDRLGRRRSLLLVNGILAVFSTVDGRMSGGGHDD